MIAAERQEILRLLAQLSAMMPEIRFGQLIVNLSYLAIGPTAEAVWDMEDAQLLAAIRQHIADLSERATTGDCSVSCGLKPDGPRPRS